MDDPDLTARKCTNPDLKSLLNSFLLLLLSKYCLDFVLFFLLFFTSVSCAPRGGFGSS